ncbi:Protein RIC-3, partial [Eschrichtius robustus]|nr:Protein RIC-3 [Eschrichtius robustus]
MMHHHQAPSDGQTSGARFQRSHLAEAFAKAKGPANFELVQLQEKLKETEEAMEKLINRVGPNGERAQAVTSDQEKRLLHQLREITRVMKEGKFIDSPTPEKEAEEAPYMEDWE